MANEVANLVVEISADAKKLNQELKNSEQNIQSFSAKATNNLKLVGLGMLGIATAAVAGFGVFLNRLNETTKALDDLGDTAQSIGLTTKELQRLQFQAGQAGANADGVTQSFIFMQNAIVEAAQGSQQQADAFAQLGISANELIQLKPEQQFERIAASFKNVQSSAEQVNLARTIFGRAGVDQINLLNSKLQESKELFDRFGLGLSEQQANNVDQLDKSRKLLDTIFSDFREKTAAGVAPAFDAINKGINKTIEDFGGLGGAAEFISSGIVKSMAAVADAAVLLHKPFKALGTIWEGVKLAGTNLGATIGEMVHEEQLARASLRGETTSLGDEQAQRDRQGIKNDIVDAQAKTLDDSIKNFDKVNKDSKVEVALNNIADAFKTNGDEAEKASKKVDQFKNALNGLPGAGAGAGGKTVLEGSLKKAGVSFTDEENELINRLKGFSQQATPRTDQQIFDDIIGKLSDKNTSESTRASLDLFNALGAKNTADRGLSNTGKGFGTISDESGRLMSVGSPQNIVVTVVLVPDEGRLFNAVVDSQIFQRAVVDTTNKNLLDVTRSDRS